MAPMLFADAILNQLPIKVFNHGQMKRDFTYIDDIVEGAVRTAMKPATPDTDFDTASPDSATSNAPFRVFNIGNGEPVPLMGFINEMERAFKLTAQKTFLDLQYGDVVETFADCRRLSEWVGMRPETTLHDGLAQFVNWYKNYNEVK